MTMPRAPRPTTVPSKSASPRETVRSRPAPSSRVRRVTAVASDRLPSPDPCVPVATAPATEMCGSDARLASAQPRACRRVATSPYRLPPSTVTVRASVSSSNTRGRCSSDTSRSLSTRSVKECREPTARTRGAAATTSASSSTDAGRTRAWAAYAWLPAHVVPADGALHPVRLRSSPSCRSSEVPADTACRNLATTPVVGDNEQRGVPCRPHAQALGEYVCRSSARHRRSQPRADAPSRARAAGAVVAALALAVALGACTVPGGGAAASPTASTSGPSTTTASPSPSTTTTPPPPPVQLTPSVASGAQVPVDTVVSVAASDGTVADVELTYKDPKKGDVNVEGKLDPNGANWTAGSLLEPATTYSLTMSGKNTAGVEATSPLDLQHPGPVEEAADLPERRRQRRDGGRGHAGHRPVRRARQGQGRVREEDDRDVHAEAGRLVGLGEQQRGALAPGELLAARHQGQRQRRHQQRRRR